MAPDSPFADEAFAQTYAEKHQKMARNFGQEYVHKLKARGFNGEWILDVGCGFGGTLLFVAEYFPQAQAVGIDLSEPLLALGRETAAAKGLSSRVRFDRGDVLQMDYPDDQFDLVISTNVVHHVADPLALLREIERVLKPEGMLYLADIHQSWLAGLFDRSFREAMTVPQIRGLLKAAHWPDEWFTTGMLWWRYER